MLSADHAFQYPRAMRRPPIPQGWLDRVLDALYPPKCGLCGLLGSEPICADCLQGFVPLAREVVRSMGRDALDFRAMAFRYQGRARQAVRRLKYERATTLAAPMGRLLGQAAQELGIGDSDVVVPVPIHWRRTCQRGFNQSALIAERSGLANVKTEVLSRTRYTRPQVGLSITERQRNLQGAFRCLTSVQGMRLLLVDDVYTSGGTANACAEALKSAGAAEVGMLAFCGWGDAEIDWTA